MSNVKMPRLPTGSSLSFLDDGWFGLLLTVISIVIGIYFGWLFYVKALRRPSVLVTLDSTFVVQPIQSHLTKTLQIHFNGQAVEQVTSSTVAIWNNGTEVFKESDIAPKEPLIFTVNGGIFLQTSIIDISRPVIHGRLENLSGSKVELRFDFFEPSDAIVINFLHSALPSSLDYSGTLIGLPRGIRVYNPKNPFMISQKASDLLILVIPSVIIASLIYLSWKKAAWHGLAVSSLALGSMILFVSCIGWLTKFWQNRWKSNLPKQVLKNANLMKRLESTKAFRHR